MKRLAVAMLAVLLTLGTLPAGAASSAPEVSASSAILVDADSGRVLYEKNAYEQRSIASITKLMTALVAVECGLDPDKKLTIRQEWTGIEGSSMYLKAGEELTLRELLYGLLLASGNDAAVAIAGCCGGDVETFVSYMNDKAQELGMADTHFANPNGLDDPEHYSTAADMALLGRAVMEQPLLAEIVATGSATVAGRSLTNHNKLLWQYEGCIGLKTGYTDEAGRTLVSCAQCNGQRLIAVTLNAPDDWRDHTALFDYGFATWPRQILARAGKEAWSVRVSGSLVGLVGVCTYNDIYYPLSQDERVRAVLTLAREVEAPVKKGSIAGEIRFYLDETLIGTSYLVYSQDVHTDLSKYESLLERIGNFFQRYIKAAK